jgi:hypothetical protein
MKILGTSQRRGWKLKLLPDLLLNFSMSKSPKKHAIRGSSSFQKQINLPPTNVHYYCLAINKQGSNYRHYIQACLGQDIMALYKNSER